MKNRLLPAIICLSGALLVASCAKVGPTGPTGPAGPSYTGNISGHVSLYDMYGSPVLTGLAAVKVSLNAGAPIYPNTTGYYLYSSVTTGSYTLSASTDSMYAATEASNVNFVVGTLTKDLGLSAIPPSFITAFSANAGLAGNYDSLVIQVTDDTRARNCIVFMNKTSAVGNIPSKYLLKYIVPVPANATSVSLIVHNQELTNAGLVSGSKVYFAAYSYVVNDASVYQDVVTGKNVYNAVDAGPAIDSAIVL